MGLQVLLVCSAQTSGISTMKEEQPSACSDILGPAKKAPPVFWKKLSIEVVIASNVCAKSAQVRGQLGAAIQGAFQTDCEGLKL